MLSSVRDLAHACAEKNAEDAHGHKDRSRVPSCVLVSRGCMAGSLAYVCTPRNIASISCSAMALSILGSSLSAFPPLLHQSPFSCIVAKDHPYLHVLGDLIGYIYLRRVFSTRGPAKETSMIGPGPGSADVPAYGMRIRLGSRCLFSSRRLACLAVVSGSSLLYSPDCPRTDFSSNLTFSMKLSFLTQFFQRAVK